MQGIDCTYLMWPNQNSKSFALLFTLATPSLILHTVISKSLSYSNTSVRTV